MRSRVLLFALPVAALCVLLGAAWYAAVGTRLGAALVALGLALALGALAGWMTVLSRRLDRQSARLEDLAGRVGAADSPLADRLEARVDRLAATRREESRRQRTMLRSLLQSASWVRRELEALPSDTANLTRLLDRTAPGAVPVPGGGGWAATTRPLLAVAAELYRADGPVTVLECGSGTSTVLAALVLRDRGRGGHVWALEADPAFAEETRTHLRDQGLTELATVLDAPLVGVEVSGRRVPWYSLEALPASVRGVGVLVVDGPIGTVADQARHPALVMLGDRLVDGCLVVLDDTNREDEAAIVQRWVEEGAAGRQVAKLREVGRATLLRVGSG